MGNAIAQPKRNPGGGRRIAPGPRGQPLVGSFFELQRLGQVRFYIDNWNRHGDVVRFRLGPYIGHIIAHPEHVRYVLAQNQDNYAKGLGYHKTQGLLGNGLLTSEGDLWRQQRRLMQPPFTPRGVQPYASVTTDVATSTVELLELAAAREAIVDISKEMLKLAVNVIGRVILSADVSNDAADMVDAYGDACEFVNQRLSQFIDVPSFIPTAGNRRFTQSVALLDRLVYRIIAERQAEPVGKPDLLQKLLDARDEETGRGMSVTQIRDEVITMFFAGHETTALALTWAWYLLALNPEVEAKLHAEVDRVLVGRVPTVEDLPNLPYVRMVVDETLRLYPPVWTFPRQAIADDEIGGYHIPAGSLMFPSQYLTHRHPRFWEDPERFDPERFLPQRAEGRQTFAYYPFGGGSRTCIGVHFALLEACLVLATMAQRIRPRLASDRPVEPRSIITLHPDQGLPMRVEGR